MAIAKIVEKGDKIERVVIQGVVTKTIILELSEQEAEVVLSLTAKVSGEPNSSPRKYSDNVYRCLKNLFNHRMAFPYGLYYDKISHDSKLFFNDFEGDNK